MSVVTNATAGTITGPAGVVDLGGSVGLLVGLLAPVPKAALGVGVGFALFPPGSLAMCSDPGVPPAGVPGGTVLCYVDVSSTWIQTDTYTPLT